MNVLLDGQAISPSRGSMRAVLEAALAQADAQGRIIIEAQLDGTPISDADLQQPSDELLPTSAQVRFTSAEPRAMLRVTLLDAAEALDTARTEQDMCAALVQEGKIDESLPHLRDALTTWQAVRSAVEMSAAMLARQGHAPAELTAQIEPALTALAGHLNETKRALGEQDWSALADVLMYDLSPLVSSWKDLLTGLADRVRTAG